VVEISDSEVDGEGCRTDEDADLVNLFSMLANDDNGTDAIEKSSVSIGTLGDWENACSFFLHDPARKKPEDGITLLGTTKPLRPNQMVSVYMSLRAIGFHGFNSVLNAQDVGCGKTRIAFALVAVHAVVERNHRDVIADNLAVRLHTEQTPLDCQYDQPGDTCPSGNPFGIMCCCTRGSLSRAIHRRMVSRGSSGSWHHVCAA
jgi:hypothetical protein